MVGDFIEKNWQLSQSTQRIQNILFGPKSYVFGTPKMRHVATEKKLKTISKEKKFAKRQKLAHSMMAVDWGALCPIFNATSKG